MARVLGNKREDQKVLERRVRAVVKGAKPHGVTIALFLRDQDNRKHVVEARGGWDDARTVARQYVEAGYVPG